MDTPNVYSVSTGKPKPDPTPEAAVFEAAQKGEAEAFGKLYDFYYDKIFQFVYYRTSHQQTAEDVTEEIFVKAFKGIAAVKGGVEKLSGWIFQIARHAVIDHYRKRPEAMPLTAEFENLPSYEQSALDMLQMKADQHMLLGALQQLPPEQQQVLKLRFLEELTISEIAAMLGKSEGNIRILQFRGLTKLRTLVHKSSLE